MSRPRILLADDHRIVAEGLKELLLPEFELLGIVEDGRTLVEEAKKLRPDVIVADITMPHLNGIDALARDDTKERVGNFGRRASVADVLESFFAPAASRSTGEDL